MSLQNISPFSNSIWTFLYEPILILDKETVRSLFKGGENIMSFNGPGGTVIHNLLQLYTFPSFV